MGVDKSFMVVAENGIYFIACGMKWKSMRDGIHSLFPRSFRELSVPSHGLPPDHAFSCLSANTDIHLTQKREFLFLQNFAKSSGKKLS